MPRNEARVSDLTPMWQLWNDKGCHELSSWHQAIKILVLALPPCRKVHLKFQSPVKAHSRSTCFMSILDPKGQKHMYPCLKKHWTCLVHLYLCMYPYVPLLKKTSDLPGTPVPLPVPCTCTNIPIPCTQYIRLALYRGLVCAPHVLISADQN